MAKLAEIYPDIRSEISGVPMPAVTRVFRTVLRRLARESYAWVETEKIKTVRSGRAEIILAPLSGVSIVRIETVTFDGEPLEAASVAQLDNRIRAWRTETGAAFGFVYLGDNVLRIAPVPSVDYSNVVVRYAVQPTRNGDYVSDQFLDDYFEVLRAGVLSELFAQKGTPWFDRVRSEREIQVFLEGIEDAKIRREQNQTKKVNIVEYGGL